jgi:hypothetical protein
VKSINFLLYIVCLFSISSYAQDFAARVKESYLETDKNFDLDCHYSKNDTYKLITPNSETIKSADKLTRTFIVENDQRSVPMTFTLARSQGRISYTVVLDKVHTSTERYKSKEFFIQSVADRRFDKDFETSKIFCSINFAYARPFTLEDGDYHFSVHPHTIYDWQSKLKTVTESYLNNPEYKSIILLETGNGRGNLVDVGTFFDERVQALPANNTKTELVNVPGTIPLIVSPSGNNRFEIGAQKQISITFSGGNHNYCIWNSTRQVLIGLMNSKSEANVNFIYDTRAIVAQPKGMEGLSLNFARGDVDRSNLLADLLSKTSIQAGYHFSYLVFFRNLFAHEYSGMYRSFKVNYEAPGYKETFIMQGSGVRDLTVDFTYL